MKTKSFILSIILFLSLNTFASIDLNYLYLRLGIKGGDKWEEDTDAALSLLPQIDYNSVSDVVLWTDVVTEQPEGYVVDDNGNVSISTAEGMAWLISTVNGLNNQTANDYDNVVITLENDIDISNNTWVAIGTESCPFKGTFDGQGFAINGIYMRDAWEGENYGLFGFINNAIIMNLELGEGAIIGYENCGGIAYFADNNSLVNGCVVKTRMDFAHKSGGIVGVNRDSKISNCAFMPQTFSLSETYIGGIAGENISNDADAIIENCFATSMFGTSYATCYAAGIASKNVSTGNEYKAIIRNCYSAPISMYGAMCGGIAAYNSENSLIENSYCKNSSEYMLCPENHGQILNSTAFGSDMIFIDPVEVFGTNIDNLLEALNAWGDNFEEGEYLRWITDDYNINYGYPLFAPNNDKIMESIIGHISIYPNPAEDNFIIEADDITQIEIYNTVGQMVERVDADDDSVEINVSAYNSGIYMMKITLNNGQTYTEKVVVR